MKSNVFVQILSISAFVLYSANASATPSTPGSSETSTAAATAYCLAVHPYQTRYTGQFTASGYERVSSPGIVGAVRRNFIYDRSSDDQGLHNGCKEACSEFGSLYGGAGHGRPLRQRVRGGHVINSGIGDLGTLVFRDQNVVAGMWSRGNNFHENDVAASDYCCCQAY